MKVAVFYPTQYTAWSITIGVRDALIRMGHEVTDGGNCEEINLDHQDIIFVCGPEHLMPLLRKRYPTWDALAALKIGWLHETVEREDYVVPREDGAVNHIAVDGKLPIEALKIFTPHLFTPATQDQKYGLFYMPFGVDTLVFHPRPKVGVGSIFTGALYKKRREFLEKYPETNTLAGYHNYTSIEEYAEAIGRATTVLNLPILSDTSNTRTFEALASKTALITPILEYDDQIFTNGKHLLYYSGNPASAFTQLNTILAAQIAQQGYDEIVSKHTIDHRVNAIIKKVTVRLIRRFTRNK